MAVRVEDFCGFRRAGFAEMYATMYAGKKKGHRAAGKPLRAGPVSRELSRWRSESRFSAIFRAATFPRCVPVCVPEKKAGLSKPSVAPGTYLCRIPFLIFPCEAIKSDARYPLRGLARGGRGHSHRISARATRLSRQRRNCAKVAEDAYGKPAQNVYIREMIAWELAYGKRYAENLAIYGFCKVYFFACERGAIFCL